jgi:hypothetical protein
MKMKLKIMVGAALLAIMCFVGYTHVAKSDVKQKANTEMVRTANVTPVSIEAYKIQDEEYNGAVVSMGATEGGERITILSILGLALLYLFSKLRVTPKSVAFTILFVAAWYIEPVAGATLAVAVGFDADQEASLEKLFIVAGEKHKSVVEAEIKKALVGVVNETTLKQALKDAGIEEGGIAKIVKGLEDQGAVLRKIQMEGQETGKGDWRKNISKAFQKEGLIGKINDVFKAGAGKIQIIGGTEEFAEKAVGNITTANVTTDSGGNAILDMINADDLQGMNLRDPWIEQFATVTRTAKPVYTYADFKPGEGDAAFLAESASKSQVDLDIAVKTVTPKKVAAYEIMSEEALTDIPRMDSEAKMLILKRVLLKRQSKILAGTGAGDDPNGVIGLARAWSNASWTGDKVTDVNLYDVIVAMANQIYTTYNYTDEAAYYPNLAVMNPADLAALKLKKNEFGMYLFPAFQLVGSNGQSVNVDGITVLPKRDITAGYIMMGDFTKLRIINYIDYSLRMGFVNDQFIKNLFTMLGESRFYTVIKDLDRNAFIYDTIANVKAGIQAV